MIEETEKIEAASASGATGEERAARVEYIEGEAVVAAPGQQAKLEVGETVNAVAAEFRKGASLEEGAAVVKEKLGGE